MADLRAGLRELSLQGVQETGREIGKGAYGVVQEYVYKGLRCAGKVIHDNLISAESEQNAAIVQKFQDECIFLSKQRHPNIVLFLGVYFKGNAIYPALLMELLPTSLNDALNQYKNMPPYIKSVILYDIACGLNFLHDRRDPLVHRDLSSNNVLLSENFRAKIADLGVARIISRAVVSEGNHMQLTNVPGTPAFMPPEAFDDDPEYDQSLDMFSYGNLILNTVNQKWPRPSGNFTKDKTKKSEVDRRKVDLDEMGETHSLKVFTVRCLQDDKAARPSAMEAAEKLFQEIQAKPPPFTDAMQMVHHIAKLSGEAKGLENTLSNIAEDKQTLERESSSMKNEITTLKMEVNVLKEEVSTKQKYLDLKNDEIQRLTREIELKDMMIRQKEGFIESLKTDNADLKQRTGNKMKLMEPTASLQWSRCAPLPCERKHVQAVEFEEKIYVGSGYGQSDEKSRQVYCYNPMTNEWEDCPSSSAQNFAMAVFENKLLLIGGKQNNNYIKKVQYLAENKMSWVFYESKDMPEMLTARAGAVATSSSFGLVVAGGYGDSRSRVSTVEVYDRSFKRWFNAPPLPHPCAELKTALVHGDQWYLLGGSYQYKQVFTTSLPKLVDASVHMSDQNITNGRLENHNLAESWTSLLEVPYEFSAVANFGGSLIAIGGEKGAMFGTSYLPQIHVFNSNRKVWVHAADMEVELSKATAITHSSGELFIIAGRNKTGNELKSVYKCKLICSKSCMEQN